MTGVLIRKKREIWRQRRHTEGRRYGITEAEIWSVASLSQGTPRMEGKHGKLEEAGRTVPWGLQRERGPADTLVWNFETSEV